MPHRTHRRLVFASALLAVVTAGAPVSASWASSRSPRSVAPSTVRSPEARTPRAKAYPSPGTVAASPTTGITLRDIDPDRAPAVQVTGSVTGAHALTARRHADLRGVTLQPQVAFLPGEQVTVRGVQVAGARAGSYTFEVARPGRHPGLDFLRNDGLTTQGKDGLTTQGRSTRAATGPPYKTRPDLNPPRVTVSTPATGTAPGLLLTNPGSGAGVQIMDNTGQPVWYHPAKAPVVAGDLEKARYHGEDVLVWFEGLAPYGPGSYRGRWTMVNSRYETVATIRAANGMQADLHDIEITPAGRAYVIIYHPVIRDLRSIGGSATANVLELVIQEVDIASGDLLFEWHSLDAGHFPVSDSVFPVDTDIVDYIHGNSLMTDTDNNLLLSARNTSTVFKINRATGAVMWRLGGRRNQFTFSPAGEPGPSAQHDALRSGPGVISIFDNGVVRNSSRGVAYSVDETAHTATRIRERKHVPNHFSFAQGNYRQLSNGNSLVSWGISGLVTEYDASGTVKFEATVAGGDYRTVRTAWTGRPPTRPAVVVERHGASDTVFVSWNGETDISSWEVRTGTARSGLTTVTTVPRDGFETSITVPDAPFVQVVAKQVGGATLGSSAIVPVGPWFTERSAKPVTASYRPFSGNFSGGPADDVVFYAPGSAKEYLWTAVPGGSFTDAPIRPIAGDYHPLVGNFVGDSHDDIIWWTRGGTRAYLWRSDGAGGFAEVPIHIPGAALARVLPHRAGPDELLWYNPGRGADRISSYRWPAAASVARASSVSRSITVNGTFQPVVGDFDGNGWTDILWYGRGGASDQYWRLTGNAGGASFGQVATTPTVNGVYTPVVGRFSASSDPRDDIAWYAPGPAVDFVWEGTTGQRFVESTHPTTFSGTPVLLRGAQDHLYLRTGSVDGTIWVPNGHPDIVRPAGDRAFPSGARPIAGDFEDTGVSGILWYSAGSAAERLFRGRLG